MLSAITLDYWDTLYDGAVITERVVRHSTAVRAFVASLGRELPDDEWKALYLASAKEAERWWREEQRGYVTADRIRWLLERLGLQCEAGDPRLDDAVRAVDEALVAHPPPLLPGAAEAVRALAGAGLRLAIVSDTGFASGAAQTALLERDGLAHHFQAIVYSCDVGRTKPHASMYHTALEALGVAPAQALHVGDLERTDVAGALAVGMRAVRMDVLRSQGESAAELVAASWDDVLAHIGVARDAAA